jgi:hypothetical protein
MNELDKTASALTKRYADAYLHARTVTGFGDTVKLIAMGIAGLIVFGGIAAGSGYVFFACFISAAVTGTALYFLGVAIACQGQIALATLDSAVNSSPFLEDAQKAKIMSLPVANEASGDLTGPSADLLKCSLCANTYPSTYHFKDDGKGRYLVCTECGTKYPPDQIAAFMKTGAPPDSAPG